MKIAVALSGGVDSTSVASRLKQQGHDVIGLTMRLCPDVSGLPSTARSQTRARPGLPGHGCSQCVAPCACLDATRAAAELGIQHEILDFRSEFEALVIAPFVRAFAAGMTPNPCALCNREMKFGLLPQAAQAAGAEALATGHYARLLSSADGAQVGRALDAGKDQTYFLSWVRPGAWDRVLFPLGESIKSEIQACARQVGGTWAEIPTSTEICFLRDRGYAEFIHERAPQAFVAGEIVDTRGKVLGEHRGLPHYTVGQRRGLGISNRAPMYVIALCPETNRVVVGPDEALWTRRVRVLDMNWQAPLPTEGIKAQIRYRQAPSSCLVRRSGPGECEIEFEKPVRAVTPGQVAAVYHNDRLLGGGRIMGSTD